MAVSTSPTQGDLHRLMRQAERDACCFLAIDSDRLQALREASAAVWDSIESALRDAAVVVCLDGSGDVGAALEMMGHARAWLGGPRTEDPELTNRLQRALAGAGGHGGALPIPFCEAPRLAAGR